MPDFLSNAACGGRRPLHLSARHDLSRPDLIAKLLRERHVARFIVAPDGFGKTALAIEYADTVFSFENVFWLEGRSPCFLRDLDRGLIARTLLARDPHPSLVVVEDVPPLDPERVERLSEELDCMLERACEVLVTCTPSCDAFSRHRDRIRLCASDLLLFDKEIDARRSPSDRAIAPAADLPRPRRVAGLAWAGKEERVAFLKGAMREELPSDVLLPLFSMLVLQEGMLEELAAFGPLGAEEERLLGEQYIYLGIDLKHGTFATAPLPVDELAQTFSERMAFLARRSYFPDADALVARLGDALVAQGNPERGCDLVRLMASRSARAEWLAARGAALFEAACLLPACEAHRSLKSVKAGAGAMLGAFEASRRMVLGDRLAASAAARRAANDVDAPLDARLIGSFVLARCAGAAEGRRAEELAASLVESGARGQGVGDRARPALAGDSPQAWSAALEVRARLNEASCEKAAQAWLAAHDRGVAGRFFDQTATEVLWRAARDPRASARGPGEADAGLRCIALNRLAAIVRKRVCKARSGPLPLRDAMAGMAFERASERGIVSLTALDAKSAIAVRQLEMRIFEQRSACDQLKQERAERKRSFVATHPDAFRREEKAQGLAKAEGPDLPLTVNLIGGLEVRIGEERVDPDRFRRQKVKTLLALLVLHGGREYSRDKLVSLLWPDSDLEFARRNFYGIWSMLRRALSTPEGSCPYLIRQQRSLRLEGSLLNSDVAQLDDICRTLLFERPGYGGWAHLFAQINDRFSDDILPSENDNDALAELRADYRTKLVDALVAASMRLVDAGEVQEGLWFARAALQRDRTREDAYTALMRAQISSGQRTAALDTYFSCRRFLTGELGIDPSLETMRLYHSVIETEAQLE